MGRRLKAVTDKPVLLGVGISNAGAGGRGGAVGRRRDRRQRARRAAAAGRRARRRARVRARAARRARRRLSPWLTGRDQVPRVEAPAGPGAHATLRGGRRRAPRSTSSPARPASRRSSSARGAHVTAVDTARYSEVFAQLLRRDRRAPRSTWPSSPTALDDLERAARRSPGTSPRRSASSRASSSRSTARASTRSATRSSATTRGTPLVPDPAHQPDRGRRPGRLHHRRADGLREAVGAALVPPARAAGARAARRAPARAVRGDALERRRHARRRSTSPTSTRRTTSTATSPTTTCGRRWSRGTRPSTTAWRASASTPATTATKSVFNARRGDARRARAA